MKNINRRSLLQLSAGGAVLGVAAPAIIGRAIPASAQTSFAGESLIVVSWSGNYELNFRDAVINPFNEKYGTKVETVGGWDQMVSQIKAAPADNPPFDITVMDEYTAHVGLAENIFLDTDRSKMPGFEAVYPWFDATRGEAKKYGVPFGGGVLWLLTAKSTGIKPDSWKNMWDEKAAGKVTMDVINFGWDLCIPAVLSDRLNGIEEVYGSPAEMEPLFQELEKLKVARWYKDGAELSNLMYQEEAGVAMVYSTDVFDFITKHADDFEAAVPKEGSAAYTDWYVKVRGTRHNDLSDLFQAYLLEKDTQQRFLNVSTSYMSRSDMVAPAHFPGYPKSNDDMERLFNLFTMDGWGKFVASWEALDARMKETVTRTTQG